MYRLKAARPVQVIVGNDRYTATWYLPVRFVNHHTNVFEAELLKADEEKGFQILTLPDNDPNVFELFVQWLYLGHFKIGGFDNETYIKVWILGEQLACKEFKDHVILQLIAYSDWGLNFDKHLVKLVYEGTASGSKLRAWTVAHFIETSISKDKELGGYHWEDRKIRGQDWAKTVKELNGFATDVAEQLVKYGHGGTPTVRKNLRSFLEVTSEEEAITFLRFASVIENVAIFSSYESEIRTNDLIQDDPEWRKKTARR